MDFTLEENNLWILKNLKNQIKNRKKSILEGKKRHENCGRRKMIQYQQSYC
jgi:hypothetical protein